MTMMEMKTNTDAMTLPWWSCHGRRMDGLLENTHIINPIPTNNCVVYKWEKTWYMYIYIYVYVYMYMESHPARMVPII